ncbi:MAG TPA: hypothetical protein VG650_10925 [Mycobacteriales bacterium]|nr:hypothetical protein [Mycobacteriales bacterium]
MKLSVGIANLILGSVYMSYGVMTLLDLKRGWKTRGFSHFGAAWVAMAFTCGPHHLEHGLHVLSSGRAAGPLDLVTVLVGFPAGIIWFLLRVEALSGGRGDRFISGTPRWLVAAAYVAPLYLAATTVAAITILAQGSYFTPRMTPNVLLLAVYALVGYYLLRTQLENRPEAGGWSVSGLSLSVVFPTCGLMHITFPIYAATGRYDVEWHGLLIDWLAVPAAIYFVWVVRALYLGNLNDWNERQPQVPAEPAMAR